jgi:predicted RNA binding protein with dsRBD fold (UPF0201 family)
MKRLFRFVIACLFASSWALAAMAAEPAEKTPSTEKTGPVEVKVKPEELPKVVASALKNRFPGLEITSAAKETDNGKVIYDIELTQNGRKFESDIKEDGTILEVEKEVATKDYPKALQSSVHAKFPKGKITIVMEVNLVKDKKETPDHLEVTVETADKQEKELLFKLDGKTEFVEPAAPQLEKPSTKSK